MDSQIVNRDSAALRQPGGELYKPSPVSVIAEMPCEEVDRLERLLTHCRALAISDPRFQSMMVFNVKKLVPVLSSNLLDLSRVGRDLVGAIEDANKTILVTRGPLDLKSANVVPPQIVLDQDVSV